MARAKKADWENLGDEKLKEGLNALEENLYNLKQERDKNLFKKIQAGQGLRKIKEDMKKYKKWGPSDTREMVELGAMQIKKNNEYLKDLELWKSKKYKK